MTQPNSSNIILTTAVAFTTGCIVSTALYSLYSKRKLSKLRKFAGASEEGNDYSLFYDDDIAALTEVKPERKFLPGDFYEIMVRDCIICCVDCVVIRKNEHNGKRECLLVERSDEPAKGLWWWPGGRIYKGETFFKAAERKCVEETGVKGTPIQVLGVYNTFFPRSSWDKDDAKGTQTVNAVVLISLTGGSQVTLDDTSERFRWLPIDSNEDHINEEDKYVFTQLRRMQGWDDIFGYDM